LSKGALVALGISMLANIGLAWSVASMLPLTKLVPVYFMIRPDGTIDDSVALSTLPPSTDQAVIRAALWQYVQMREGYSYDTARYRYDIVSGMSDATTRTAYQQWFNYPNPQSPQVTVGKNGVLTVEPISVALIGPNVAQVRYERIFEVETNAAVTTTWTATIQFQQVGTMPASDRLSDPSGLIVTSYQTEEDTAP
ncbi:MAG: type IV secretion system protein VirB8, partial [Rhodospirillales bacterium]|nr:type IV secretion system protein VirB8 [Rhodospirillales bacterium]